MEGHSESALGAASPGSGGHSKPVRAAADNGRVAKGDPGAQSGDDEDSEPAPGAADTGIVKKRIGPRPWG